MSLKRPRLAELSANSRLANFACKRCRSRKVKCDAEFPQCAGCSRADVPCIVADYSAPRDFTRSEVQSLEERLAELETLAASSSLNGVTTHVSGERPLQSLDATRYVGPESGINFIQPIVDAMRRQGHPSPQQQELLIEFRAPHRLPSRSVAQRVIEEYFREFHIGHPILDQEQMTAVVEKVYNNPDDYYASLSDLSNSQKSDLFRLNMVLAIGSIQLSRKNLVLFHPFGLFTAALEANPPSEYRFCAIEDVENLLLIALFGLFYNIGCSIWELGRLCVRICIELRLHCQQGDRNISDAEVQRCRRVFWEAYLLDRFSSSMLGRPYAIDDAVIDIDVPDQLSGSPFSHVVRLGRITSEMHVAIFFPELERSVTGNEAKHVSSSDLLSNLRRYHGKLRSWRLQAPVFERQTCVYETVEFFEMNLQESRLWLFRAAINNLPAALSNVRDKLLLLCLQAAQQIVRCFNILWQRDLAICSRSSTRLILISGLVTISVFKMQTFQHPRSREEDDVSGVDIDFWLEDLGLDSSARFPTVSAFRETIENARTILSGLAKQMPDVVAYARFFEILDEEVERSHQSTSDPALGAVEVATDIRTRTNANSSDPATMVAVPTTESSHAQQQFSYVHAQQIGDMTQSSLGLHEQQSTRGTALDDLLLNMYQGDHMFNNNDGALLGSDTFWSFPHAPWMEEVDGDISGFIWDTAMSWQGSPFANT
ncbi:hypothetical protein DE146DRAFT_145154 [Phaeosphaeria sp. MPI-PUGE-AT-0046c]|nr:hypothetical protein DE146DRAFT_145154 [Phaeosphaeria sp. MPI-PUGE-AT-0046c]